MHGRVAAGKLTDIAFDDEGKRIVVAAKIVDEDEWRKVCEGVYTGFSQGGRYVKRWPDSETSLVRYTAEPREISLVDLPCLPDATFEVVKDGVVEKRAFAARAGARRAHARKARPPTSADPAEKLSGADPRARGARQGRRRARRSRAQARTRRRKRMRACARRSTMCRRRSPISRNASPRSRPSRCRPRPRCAR